MGSIPRKVSGAWVPVQPVFEDLAAGVPVEEITGIFDGTAVEV